MAKKCFEYRGKIYPASELFDKVRRNATQFVKRHSVSGYDVEQVLGKTKSAEIYYNIAGGKGNNSPQPLPHKNTMPAKTFKEVSDKFTLEGIESAQKTLEDSAWYKSLSDAKKQEITSQGLAVTMINEGRKIVENTNVKKSNAKVEEQIKAEEKVQKTKKHYQNKIEEIKENFREKLQKIKDSNKEAKVKIKERSQAVRDMVNDVKSFLASNKIDGYATPAEINRLIKKASELSQRRDLSKALDEFYKEYLDIQIKAEDRKLKDEKRVLTDVEFEELRTLVEDQLENNVSQKDIEFFIKTMDLPFSKGGTLSDVIKSEIEKIINQYKVNQLSPEEKLEKINQAEQDSNEILKKKKINWTREAIKKISDRQFMAKFLAAQSGMINTYNRIIVAAGASSAANYQFDKARNKIFKGLKIEERKNLDIIINLRRIIAIEENRKSRGLGPINHTGGYGLDSAKETLKALETSVGSEVYSKLNNRATEYFSEFKSILDAMLKNGIISTAQYDSMINIDYQPRFFIEHLLDSDGRLMDDEADKFSNENGGLKKDMLHGLSDGSIGSQIMNAEWILKLALASRNRQMAQNEINRTFITRDLPEARLRYNDLKSKTEPLSKDDKRFIKYFEELTSYIKENPIIGVNKSGNPEYKYDKTPKGYKKAYYFENGVRHEFFMENELHKQFHDAAKGELTHETKEALAKASGSRIIKFFATGANPAFVIANTPRDFAQTIAFSKEYSDIVPYASIQLIRDAINGVKELIKDDRGNESLLSKYIEYGGGMDFLHTQGMVKRDNLLMEATEKLISPKGRDNALLALNSLSLKKLSRYSETMFRLAIFHRSINNQLREFNKDNGTNYKTIEEIPNSQIKEDIYLNASASARGIMDFNQGGTVTKDLESIIPYVNAATQGTRVAVDAFTQRPKQTAFRVAQLGALMATTGVGLSYLLFSIFAGEDDDDERSIGERILWAYDGISKYQRINSINIPTPFKTEKGEYYVIKISKTQFMTPVAYFMEENLLNIVRGIEGQKTITQKDIIKNTLWAFNNNVTPINTQLGSNPLQLSTWMDVGADNLVKNPLAKAVMTSVTGYDFFRDQPLDKGAMGKDLPKQLEGIRNDKVEGFFKAYGELIDQSPIRTKAIIESFVTSPDTNPWIGLIYGGAELLATDKNIKEVFGEHGEKAIGSMTRRLRSETSEFSRMLKIKEEKQKEIDEIIIKGEKNKAKADELSKKLINKEISGPDVEKELKSLDASPEEKSRLLKRILERVAKPDTAPQILDIKYSTNDPRVKAFLIHSYYPDLQDGSKKSSEIMKLLVANEIFTKSVFLEYNKIFTE